MAGRLVNEFSWSFSRHNTFKECQKKYWYTYYGSWEGWPLFRNDARDHLDPLAAYLYSRKQMQHLPMFIGSLVHSAIELSLKDHQRYRRPVELSKLKDKAHELLRKGVEDSESEKWRESPKRNFNLFEIYYAKRGKGSPLDVQKILDAEEKVERCLDHWYHSPIVQKMILDPRAHWLSIEQLDKFYLDGLYKVYVVIDFAMKWRMGNGEPLTLLFDWKTGMEREGNVDQLLSYALFATEAWGTHLDRLVLTPFYVDANSYQKYGAGQEEGIGEEKLKGTADFIRSSAQAMLEKAMGPVDWEEAVVQRKIKHEALEPLPEDFAYTDNRRQCYRCPFKELCEQVDYEPVSAEALRKEASTLH